MAALERPLSWCNLRLIVEYDGTDFQGWQSQNRGRTVQDELSRALSTLLGKTVVPIASGRTDAGTHALAQVVHIKTSGSMSMHHLRRGLNGLLPKDISILKVESVPADFHSRYDASGKRYRYRIITDKTALHRSQVWSCYRVLELQPMRAAAAAFVGKHRFGAFCKQDPPPEHFECVVREAGIEAVGREIVFEIEANRFLRHMVRIMVGTLVEIGSGRRPAGDIQVLLESGDRALAGPTAPARGLCLVRVSYL